MSAKHIVQSSMELPPTGTKRVTVFVEGLPDYIADSIENALCEVLEPLNFDSNNSDDGRERIIEFIPPEV